MRGESVCHFSCVCGPGLEAVCKCLVTSCLSNLRRARARACDRGWLHMDLSLEIDQNCSVTSCLRNFRQAGLAREGGMEGEEHALMGGMEGDEHVILCSWPQPRPQPGDSPEPLSHQSDLCRWGRGGPCAAVQWCSCSVVRVRGIEHTGGWAERTPSKASVRRHAAMGRGGGGANTQHVA